MSEVRTKNRTDKSNGNRKFLVAAACVVFVLAVMIVGALVAKNPFYAAMAQKKAENGEFSVAAELISKTEGKKSETVETYIMLRLDINRCYPGLLTEFDAEKITEWRKTLLLLNENSDLLGRKITADIAELSEVLSVIMQKTGEYEAMRADVLSMMDVFPEINRLHTKGDDGKNIGFTVAEEKEKIRRWEGYCDALEQYSLSIDADDTLYLLTFLIKEVQGECADLEKAVDSVTESGYSETDRVRFSGEGRKSYPDIRSSNASVNLLEKENYEFHLYKGICRMLVESLGGFYKP